MRKLIVWVLMLVIAGGLAACGGTVGGGRGGETEIAKPGPVKGDLNISTWPGYIDKGEGNTIDEFESKYPGTTVNYTEDVNDNSSFFGKVQPLLAEGKSGDRSIMVVTDWMAKQMHDLGYLQEIKMSDVPNVDKNLIPSLRNPAFDPGRKYSIPWQSGMTGLLVNKSEAPDVRSINDLFDPKYRGKVTVLTELRDTIPLMLKADGIDPAKATKQQWLNEIDRLNQAVESGQMRRFTGNDYVQDLDNGNVVASIGWSGDVELISNPQVEWRMPTTGCIIWSDNMVIPVGAPNTPAALAWMNFVYDPKVQADISDYVRYVSPVNGIEKYNPQLASDPLVNPPASFIKNCSTQPNPPGGEAGIQEITAAFESVVNK